ncbi:MAG: hypothetical protein ACR2FL_03080, partial [Nocardioidaceae bacterium]
WTGQIDSERAAKVLAGDIPFDEDKFAAGEADRLDSPQAAGVKPTGRPPAIVVTGVRPRNLGAFADRRTPATLPASSLDHPRKPVTAD